MSNLLIGILSSLIASILVYLLLKPIRDFINSIFLILKGNKKLGINSILFSRDQALKKIHKDISKSQELMILNFKGFSLLDNSNFVQTKLYQFVYHERIPKIRFLLLNPDSEKYIKSRKQSLDETIKGSSTDDYVNDIRRNIETLRKINSNKNSKTDCFCRLFNEELKWNLIFSDNFIIISFYPLNKIAHKSPCIIVNRKNTLLGISFEKYFNDVWQNHSTNAYLDKSDFRSIIIAGGSFQGKSLIAISLANKYEFSGVLTTDMIRNFLKIQNPNEKYLSTSTYKLNEDQLKMQMAAVSSLMEKQLEIYKTRGEKIIVEGMHFSDDFIKMKSKENCLKLFLNNNKTIKERVILKQKTRHRFSIDKELEYSPIDSIEFEKTSYYINQDRISEIHENLKSICLTNGFIEVNFENLDDAIKKCEKLVEEYLLKPNV